MTLQLRKTIMSALLQVKLCFELEEITGDFPEPEWIEVKRLVRKAIEDLKELNK